MRIVLDTDVIVAAMRSPSGASAAILFGALMDCDGHWGSMTYISRRYAQAADFQTIALLAGYRTTAVQHERQGGCYTVCAISPRKPFAYATEAWLEQDGPEEAWCISTANGTIIAATSPARIPRKTTTRIATTMKVCATFDSADFTDALTCSA